MAVVTVDRDIPVPAGYAYPRVAGSGDTALTAIGRNTHFVGYGRIALDENTSSFLRQTDLPIVDGAGCRSFLPSYNADYMFCSGYQDGRTGICQGDSGGGALVDGVIVGVASFVRTGCNSYSGFARLTNAMGDWVNAELSGNPGPGPGPGQPPTASMFAHCNLASCQFDGQFSRDPDGTIVSYAWDFGDGSRGSGRQVTHAYPAAAATYTVRLTVTDNSGNTGSTTRTLVCQRFGTFTFCSIR